jgi:hypothetical protein
MEKFFVLLILAAIVVFLGAVTWFSKFFVREGKSKMVLRIMDLLMTLRSQIEKLLRWLLPPS